ncbi:metalloregulator ArsR/SmtB family transcription factor [Pendulispora albinea]|uniref:Metalloregulator ArsR/SmtB family transcription factor n=1 Tax=Pendulispora albinea TaxID=2741071 RepID=A0ABZ2M173_9BACT
MPSKPDESGIFGALADPTRRAILRLLRRGSKSAGDIAAAFDLAKPTLSHHFAVLRRSGLVRAERRGTSIVYTLQTSALEEVAAELLELVAPVTSAASAAGRSGGLGRARKERLP